MATAFDELKKHAAQERSGEMIVATDELEVHVYLQNGRVAWATSSKARYAFARYLATRCGLEREMFRQVIEECQRTKKPLGETLVAWKLATADQVREALRAQMIAALGQLAEISDVRELFLDRGEAFREYTREMTFDIDELEAALVGADKGDESIEPAGPAANDALKALADKRRDLLWALSLHDGTIESQQVSSGTLDAGVITSLLPQLLEIDGTHVAVLREPCGSVVGMPMPDGTSVWCALQTDGNVGAVIRELEKLSGRKPAAGITIETSRGIDSIRSPQLVGACGPLEAAIEKTPELGAAFVRRLSDESLSVVRRKSFPLDPHESIAQKYTRRMDEHCEPVVGTAACPPGVVWDEGPVGLRIRIGGYWYCSSRAPATGLCLWLVLTGNTNLGFCQALLDTLSRQVAAALSRSE